jgi:SAM-dependent methyltransferase
MIDAGRNARIIFLQWMTLDVERSKFTMTTMLDRLFSIGPIRKTIWRLWYPYLTRRIRSEGVLFLNYAFETEPPVDLQLRPEDEPNRACIQLYHHVASQAALLGKEVLEVSCGHGGGASWISRSMQPASYTGLDLNPTGIEFCQRHHHVPGLTFKQGDAQNLPFPDQSFDAVINVEASHCYPDFSGFLSEVARVLRPGGYFLYADFRFRQSIPEWESAINATPLKRVRTRNIGTEVLRGMDHNAQRSRDLIRERLPGFLQSLGNDFAGVPGSRIYSALQTGELSYRSWCFQKS